MSAFVRWDANTKIVLSTGVMDDYFIEQERANGVCIDIVTEPFLTNTFEYINYFDPETRTVRSEKLPEAVPLQVSKTQFYQECVKRGYISKGDALTAIKTGDLPPSFESALESLTEDERFDVEMKLHSIQFFGRNDSFIPLLAAKLGITDKDMDSIFTEAAKL